MTLPESVPEPQALSAQAAVLRHAAGAVRDPIRSHFLDVMARRARTESGELKQVLEERLRAVARRGDGADDGVDVAPVPPVAADRSRRAPGASQGCAPLAELNRYLRRASQDPDPRAAESGDAVPTLAKPELKSVRRFSQTWSRIVADDQLEHAFGRAPENAGPLNSHMLMLRSLSWMKDLSPDYLRRFMAHVDSLLWLEQASPKIQAPARKTVRRARTKP